MNSSECLHLATVCILATSYTLGNELTMTTYTIGSLVTACILLHAFLKDNSTAKTDGRSWLFLLFGISLWFVVLPFIVRKKVSGSRQSELVTIAN
jgi:hypothetical protein